ncbi:hypothetical protein [Legionella gresilensis]|uniref:hypothetical protein n=1 Tax=Legionella gresilensis TaxID=91823 RepID=UPI00104153E3|nr:hypothetical protein [Legionella gresilensis]
MALKDLARNNSSFQLKCLLALAGTAVVTLGVIAALSIKASAAAPTTALLASAAAVSPIIPIALPVVLLTIGAVCLLPFLFSSACRFPGRSYTTAYSSPFYRSSFFSTPIVDVGTTHRHSSNPFDSNYHSHTTSSYHGHGIFSSASNHHGHSGSVSTNHGHIGGYGASSNYHGHR